MKKSLKVILFIFIIVSFFTGCFHRKEVVEEQPDPVKINIYKYVLDYTKGVFNNEKDKYLPDFFVKELKSPIFQNSCLHTIFDIYFPGNLFVSDYFTTYDCNSDNGNWVIDVITAYEEERIAEEIMEMENLLNGNGYINDEEQSSKETEEKVKEKSQEITKKEVLNINKNLAYLEYGDEIFIPQQSKNELILIYGAGNNITRNFYDTMYRAFKKENWNIDNSGKEELLQTINTIYYQDSYKAESKEYISKERYIIEKYNPMGFLETKEEYIISDGKKVITSSMELTYTKDNKVKKSEVVEYTYKKDDYSKLLYTFNKKYLYSYAKSEIFVERQNHNEEINESNDKEKDNEDNIQEEEIPPDFDYYENNVLKIRNRYTTPDSYTSQIFFDDGYNVITFYENNKPVKEVYYSKNGVDRIKNYE